jgi:hypothetical protein
MKFHLCALCCQMRHPDERTQRGRVLERQLASNPYSVDKFLVAMIDPCEIHYTREPSADQTKIGACERVWRYKRRGRTAGPPQVFSASTQRELNVKWQAFENGGADQVRLETLAVTEWTLDVSFPDMCAHEVRLLPQENLVKEGDIECDLSSLPRSC